MAKKQDIYSQLDDSVAPTDDFFSYVNAKWIQNNPMPDTEVRWGGFYVLREENRDRLRDILEHIVKKNDLKQGSDQQKLRDLWLSGVDEARAEELGVEAIRPQLDLIAGVSAVSDLPLVLAQLQAIGIDPFWDVHVNEDWKKNDTYALYVFQDGLGLPERDYYFAEDEKTASIRQSYIKHIEKLFVLAGWTKEKAVGAAKHTLEIETRLADASMTSVELRDIERMYNKVPFDHLGTYTPAINWSTFMEGFGTPKVNEVVVAQPEFLERCQEIFTDTPLDAIKDYLIARLLDSVAGLLSNDFVEENFHFNGAILTGAKEIQPRWKRVLALVDGALGEALGREYVSRHFPPEAKEHVNQMVDNLMSAYRERIKGLTWMSDVTKERALEKLDRMSRKLGYPDTWRDYSALEIVPDELVQNAFAANLFEVHRLNQKIGKPVDKTEWSMSPPTVNAYNDLVQNEIVFPAGIMQPPFFEHERDDALNYGAMGAVIGHEITHGFDDQGSTFDPSGNLALWWTSEDRAHFESLTKRVVDQFNTYIAVDDVHVNGELTVGENIADLGGVVIGYYAYMKSLEGKPEEIIHGMTPAQRYFIGWAIGECGYWRDEITRVATKTDPHSPPKWRVNGPFSQLSEFHEAFQTKEGDGMWVPPNERISIW